MPKPQDKNTRWYLFTDDIKYLQKAVILHPTDKNLFLALKRSDDSFSRPGDWDLPGGNVLYGELHLDALKREVKEEVQMEIVSKFYPIYHFTNHGFNQQKEAYFIFTVFMCQAVSNKVVLSEEHSEYQWVNKKEFLNLVNADFLKKVVQDEMFEIIQKHALGKN